jgi:hypothetical protein
METNESTAVVWASTWVPAESPIAGFGAAGYAVAWIELPDGSRRQVLVAGDSAPPPRTRGSLRTVELGEDTVELFVEEGAVE